MSAWISADKWVNAMLFSYANLMISRQLQPVKDYAGTGVSIPGRPLKTVQRPKGLFNRRKVIEKPLILKHRSGSLPVGITVPFIVFSPPALPRR
jgi:hypothetical protein